ncbi:unnamed protein product [Clonostachys rosea f. rosea IK726]|uniref:Uncharacterized protein n=1 Tax=Clonostachys rosea f. rosea IK726 TaxID=1349383 RepID=A0ACA9U7C8_BIOOC|nr:unnamed protein product [Clonostachys rosea f. rosea IK726]
MYVVVNCCDGNICETTTTTTAVTSTKTSGTTSGTISAPSSTINTSESATSTWSSSGSTSYGTSGRPTTTGGTAPTSLPTDSTSDSISDIIRTAIPTSAQTEPTAPCFLTATGDSVYTTPDWYTALPSELQSYYSSVNVGASLSSYCTAAPTSPGGSHGTPGSSLSKGGKVGVAVGAVAIAVALGVLIFLAAKTGVVARWCALCGVGAAAAEERSTPVIPTTSRLGSGMLRMGGSGRYRTGVSGIISGDGRNLMRGGAGGSVPPSPPVRDPPAVPTAVTYVSKSDEEVKGVESHHASIMTVSSLESDSGHELAVMPSPPSDTRSGKEQV